MDVKDKYIIDTVLEKFRGEKDPALMILQNVQAILGYVGKEYLEHIADNTEYSLTELYGIVTFYPSFRLEPPGKHTIKVCQGTACHVRGGEKVLKELETQLDIKPGGTTKDRLFSLESVRCLGCCGLSPVIMIDNETYGRVKPTKIRGILDKYGEADE
ncbi:MAG: NADH-quinone oxidoreductase subunit NuoE [Thermoplasmata archaeon]